ncbi:hypothetical protein RNJ44_00221 [Nakaseomyces bracarensis]|uniref:DNA ligase n=1 Tax=Nakaseomyces bracarensis TaxID=273131 RepID=A0ABR4NT97_9SACH
MSDIADEVDDEDIGSQGPTNFAPSPEFLWLCQELFAKVDYVHFEKVNNLLNKPITARYFEIIDEFVKLWRVTVGNDFYPAVRLILPYRDRRIFNIKDYTLIKAICTYLKLPKNSNTEKHLINWKQDAGRSVKLSKYCVDEIKKRRSEPHVESGQRITIDELNQLLDKLTIERSSQGRSFKNLANSEIFKRCFETMTYLELQYFFDILLKNRPIGGHEHKLLNCWHPDAQDYLSVVSDLHTVTKRLWDPSKRLGNKDLKINIGMAFTPQLAKKVNVSYEKICKKLNYDFFIEEKMDGERIQLHYLNFGKEIKFFSRRATDYTYLYGDNMEAGTLAKYLKLQENVKDCVLDCEVVTYDSNNGYILPFGMVKSSAKNALSKDNISSKGFYPLLMVFDLLYLNGSSLIDLPYFERKKYLEAVLTQTPHRIEIIRSVRANNEDMIKKSLAKALSVGSEGVILKNYSCRYYIGSRNDDWIKIKPEYLEQFGENMDLVLMGRDPAKKDSLMLGLVDFGDENDNEPILLNSQSSDENSHHRKVKGFISLCIIANGISNDEYREIERKTKNQWNDSEKVPPPEYLKFGSKIPAQWIDPKKSLVLEIKARSLDNTETSKKKFAAGCTLFGGYCRQIRDDKDWTSCYTWREFSAAKLDRTWKPKGNDTVKKIIKKKRKKLTVLSSINSTLNQLNNIDFKSSIFEDLHFYVMTDYFDYKNKKRLKKTDIQRMIAINGGTLVQNIISTKYDKGRLRILSSKNTIECESLISRGYDIISPEWVVDCTRLSKLLKLEPKYAFDVSKHLMEISMKRVDDYGDSLEQDIDEYRLKYLLDTNIGRSRPTVDILEFDEELRNIPSFLFHGRNVYFVDQTNRSDDLKYRYLLYGGNIVTNFENSNLIVTKRRLRNENNEIRESISSSVLKQEHPPRIPDLVDEKWILDSISEHAQIAEDGYRIY